MKSTYQHWLEQLGYADGTIQSQMSRTGRVEECYGDLDAHYDQDQLHGIINELKYSAEDERRNKPNPSRIHSNGNIRKCLASCRNAAELYRKFRRETEDEENITGISGSSTKDIDEAVSEHRQLFRLERDLQAALRRTIEQLEPGLEIIDDGVERSVSSGFIDITARDTRGSIVVIELKTGTARQNAVGQILTYMGDLTDEEPDAEIRGIVVASDFDKKARAAARMVPALSLRAYNVSFAFKNVDDPAE